MLAPLPASVAVMYVVLSLHYLAAKYNVSHNPQHRSSQSSDNFPCLRLEKEES